MKSTNYHCSVVEILGCGVLIEGPSGSGKTSLALSLLDQARNRQWEACLVSDDQALMELKEGKLVANTPDTLAGKVEVRGFGIVNCSYKSWVAVSLVASLVNADDIERHPQPKEVAVLGVKLPELKVPTGNEAQAVRIIMAWIAQKVGIDW